MRDILLLAFILSLPALAALGHDAYLAYNNTHLEISERFYLSDLGWLWVNYSPETYNWVIENTDAVIWNGFIDPVLGHSAFYVLSAPVAIYLGIIFIMKIFGLGFFEGHGLFKPSVKAVKKKGNFSFSGGGSAKKVKYRRK